jgi:hypothetical protein
MKKGLSKSTRSPEKTVRRKRKYDEEFKQQAQIHARGERRRSMKWERDSRSQSEPQRGVD